MDECALVYPSVFHVCDFFCFFALLSFIGCLCLRDLVNQNVSRIHANMFAVRSDELTYRPPNPSHDRHNIRCTYRTNDSQEALGRIHALISTENHVNPCIMPIPIWKIPLKLHSGHRISLYLHTTINFRTIYRTTIPSHLR